MSRSLIALLVVVAAATYASANLANEVATLYDRQAQQLAELTETLNHVQANIDSINAEIAKDEVDLDQLWQIIGVPIVFFIVIGYTLLEVGSVRSVNATQVLFKNAVVTAVTVVMWWILGEGFATSTTPNNTLNRFIGNGNIFLVSEKVAYDNRRYSTFVLDAIWASTAAIIATQTLGQRTRLLAYVLVTIVYTGFVFPTVFFWVWGPNGWLSFNGERPGLGDTGMYDLSGSAVIHISAGASALAGALILRKRLGHNDKDMKKLVPAFLQPHNRLYQLTGIFFLWVGWYGMTSIGGPWTASRGSASFGSRATINTTLCAAFASFIAIITDSLIEGRQEPARGQKARTYRVNVFRAINGVLAGLVAISAGCIIVEPWAAVVIGILAGFFYAVGARFVAWTGLDDPLEIVGSHLIAGVIGTWSPGWFARPELQARVMAPYHKAEGILYDGDAGLWGIQALGSVSIGSFAFGVMLAVYFVINYFGWLRVTKRVEEAGLDANEPLCECKKDEETK